MFGANKTATSTGGTLQLRALDWDVDGMGCLFVPHVCIVPYAESIRYVLIHCMAK